MAKFAVWDEGGGKVVFLPQPFGSVYYSFADDIWVADLTKPTPEKVYNVTWEPKPKEIPDDVKATVAQIAESAEQVAAFDNLYSMAHIIDPWPEKFALKKTIQKVPTSEPTTAGVFVPSDLGSGEFKDYDKAAAEALDDLLSVTLGAAPVMSWDWAAPGAAPAQPTVTSPQGGYAVIPHKSPGKPSVVAFLSEHFNGLDEKVKCPGCKKMVAPTSIKKRIQWNKAHPLADIVQHLNDEHRWTREAIADWIETLDIDTRQKVKS